MPIGVLVLTDPYHQQVIGTSGSNSKHVGNVQIEPFEKCILENMFDYVDYNTVVLKGVHAEDKSFTGSGYTSLAIIYAVFSLSNWLAPSVISFLRPKITMMVGAVIYCLFIAQFLYPITSVLYVGSALIGFGAAILWTAQGSFLTINSDSETISRNSGIFWALLQCSVSLFLNAEVLRPDLKLRYNLGDPKTSTVKKAVNFVLAPPSSHFSPLTVVMPLVILLFGNIFVYFMFAGEKVIKSQTRMYVYIVLTVVAGFGTILLLFLKTPSGDANLLTVQADRESNGPLQALKRSFELLKTKEMVLLSVAFFYTGLELSFFSGVYGTSIGFTQQLHADAKRFVGLSGVFIGAGEIIGGSLFGLLGKTTNKYGRDPVVVLGYVVHMICFYLIYINLPNNSPLGETMEIAYIHTNKYLALFCAFILGFGDSCFNTQIYSILGYMFPEDSAPAFALFKFVQWNYITSDGKSRMAVRCRIATAKEKFQNMKQVFTNGNISMKLKIRMLKCYIWPVLQYGCEARTLTSQLQDNIKAAEMWFLRRILRILYRDRVTNERVLERAQTSKELLKDIQKRLLTFLGHCIRKEKLECVALQGRFIGKRARGGQRIKFLDTIKTALESTGSPTTIPEIFRSARNCQLWKNMVGKSIAAAIAFGYSNHLVLTWQLLILVVSGTVGVFSFLHIEWSLVKAYGQGYQQSINEDPSEQQQ
ncbi:UNC93-like protein MFSD11 [Nymphon striatum]|nr:UNC93-like protein MFSD11 [Nymphon striatum]